MAEGFLAGYPMVDIKCVVFDGSYHADMIPTRWLSRPLLDLHSELPVSKPTP